MYMHCQKTDFLAWAGTAKLRKPVHVKMNYNFLFIAVLLIMLIFILTSFHSFHSETRQDSKIIILYVSNCPFSVGDTCMIEETSYEESNTRTLDSSTPITLGPQIEGTKQELVERCIQIIDKAYSKWKIQVYMYM